MIEKIWKEIQPYVSNKYLVTITLFVVWVMFFDRNNLMDRYRLNREVNQLNKDKIYYNERIREDSSRLKELMTSPENLEKFAREQYLMKKENEDIFIIIEED